MAPLLEVKNLTLRRDDGTGSAILSNVNLQVREGDVVLIKGESGCGKTTFLKCVSELNVYQDGEILLYGKSAESYGIPCYRTMVQYVPQRPSMLPGTPLEFLEHCRGFAARKNRDAKVDKDGGERVDPMKLASEWGIDQYLWKREWATLSGGEGQRIALAIAVGLGGADVILLDEPTSALDEQCMKAVEKSLVGLLPRAPAGATTGTDIPRKGNGKGPKALLWITHSNEQAQRVGTRELNLSNHTN